jgi:hypothetical protein
MCIGSQYEVAIYVESTRLEEHELIALKTLFEAIIDSLCAKFYITEALA